MTEAPLPWVVEHTADAEALPDLHPVTAWYLAQQCLGLSGSESDRATPQWWISPQQLDGVELLSWHLARYANGLTFHWCLGPRIASNRSWFDDSSLAFWQQQRLTLRGRWITHHGESVFEVRIFWPQTWTAQGAAAGGWPEDDETLLRDTRGAAQRPFAIERVWGEDEAATHALGFVLNGAQGDDDEAHGGHFAAMLGSARCDAVDLRDMSVANFYNPDVVSEKGILPAFTPLDAYLCEINSGQQNYRPSTMYWMTLKSERCLLALHEQLAQQMQRLYLHMLHYDHAQMNCTGITMDGLRLCGWQTDLLGPSSRLMSVISWLLMRVRDRDPVRARRLRRYFLTEQTRLLPAQAFFACTRHLYQLLQGRRAPASVWEQQLVQDVAAVYRLHFPQVPSTRAVGREPILRLADYRRRVPKNRDEWQLITLDNRPFPSGLQTPATIAAPASDE